MAFIENIGAFIRWVLKGCKTKLHNELTKEKIFINILVFNCISYLYYL